MEMKDLQYQLICQFLEGTLPSSEVKTLNNWRAENPENEKRFQETQFLWEKSAHTKPPEAITIDVDTALKKVHQEINQPGKVVNIRRRILGIASVAAAALLLIVGMVGGLKVFNSVEMIEVATLANQQKEIKLPDNSIVWLNENTSLKYPKYFNQSSREVRLKGNAVFEVTHNDKKPFIVQSADVSVKVLGTKFNVLSRSTANTLVHVLDGKVKVNNLNKENNQLIITKGMTAIVHAESEQLTLTTAYNPNDLFWMHKTLSFSNTTLKAVFEDLRKYYVVDIEIQNTKLLSCILDGEFKDKTVDEILTSLQFIFNFEIEKITSTSFKITKGKCNY